MKSHTLHHLLFIATIAVLLSFLVLGATACSMSAPSSSGFEGSSISSADPPEMEPTAATKTEDTAEADVDEPVDEPVDKTEEEPTVEPIVQSVPTEDTTGSGMAGGARYLDIQCTFDSYDELAQYYQDPLFEAYASSENAQSHDIVYIMTLHAGTYPYVSREEDGVYKISDVLLFIDGGQRPTGTHYVRMSDEVYETPDTAVTLRGNESIFKNSTSLQEAASQIATSMGLKNTETLPGSWMEDINGIEVLKYDPTDGWIAFFEQSLDKYAAELEKRKASQPHSLCAVFIFDDTVYRITGISWEIIDNVLGGVTAAANQL